MFPIPVQATVQTSEPPPTSRVSRSCYETLSSAFREIYTGNYKHLSYETLYRCAYSVVCAGHGEVLYTQVATAIATEVGKLAASLDCAASAPDAEFLRELLGRWKKHCDAVALIDDIALYMNRTFVMERCKTPVPELGLAAWREGMLAGKVLRRLQATLPGMAGRDRAGEAVDVALCVLMASVYNMLLELGDDVYQEVFVTPFIDETRRFYARESARLLASPCGCGEYLRAVEPMMDAEKARVSRCLDARIAEKVAAVAGAVVMEEMVEKNVVRLVGMEGSGLASMLVDGRYWDLTRMHRLLGRVQGGVPAMRDAMEARFWEIRNTAGDDERLMSREKESYREMIDGVFHGEVSFHAALDSCFK